FSTIKSWIQKNRDFMNTATDPFHALMIACAQITPDMATNFFHRS
ncbi:19874_t:CDS:1, partial [Racocetra fulgida]